MRAVIVGYDKETELEMERYFLKEIPPNQLIEELFRGDYSRQGFWEEFGFSWFPIRLRELIALEPYMVHKADIFKLGSQDYFLEIVEVEY